MKNKENKSESITFRVTDQQKQEIELKASEMNVGMSSYLSHILSTFENQKEECQRAKAKSIEVATQKEILENAVQAAQSDTQTVANPAFAELFERVNGKELNGKLIRSKYDLIGVLASGAVLNLSEDSAEIHTPVQVKDTEQVEPDQKLPVWMIAAIACVSGGLLVVLLYSLRSRRTTSA